MKSTLYLTRNGLLEPLGQSQVFSYLKGLSSEYKITLITYEKPSDIANQERMEQARKECEYYQIEWLPQTFRQKPRLVAPTVSLLQMLLLVFREVKKKNISLIHARSYIPAYVAYLVSKRTGIPFIFDMRALWPEEMITAGRLQRGSFSHKVVIAMERTCLKNASAVVSLTNAAVGYLTQKYPEELANQKIEIIPTCADLDRFRPPMHTLQDGTSKNPTSIQKTTVVHGCIGSVLSGWFLMDWLAAWYHGVASIDPKAHFEIITRDDPMLVRKAVDPNNYLSERLRIEASLPEHMPERVRSHSLSVMFYAGGEISELGRSPTRMAEVLGTGLPVVANEGVGDVADIIKRYNVGVLVRDTSLEEIRKSYDKLMLLFSDDDLAIRCRLAAEEVFSLQSGTKKYSIIYSSVSSE